ncbi:hypothetical protein ColTof4_04301 [Colletotrichum tofieldiae]|nr:hypothetical protein ColTof3_14149 [Colletotrichum tofieldiae]GKT71878.1 hypothetical protein ColTof4_04301 [Colletotrichum tofieldiae]GKT94939.1 hypothetical protein Ct61P_12789 [Colletotrichum tofieldiae]
MNETFASDYPPGSNLGSTHPDNTPPEPAGANKLNPLEPSLMRQAAYSFRSNEQLTESEAREALSTYYLFVFENDNGPTGFNNEGDLVESSWEQVIRGKSRGRSKGKFITRTTHYLNKKSKPGTQKQLGLTDAQQRQIEMARTALEANDPDKRFYYTLQRIDTVMKKLDKDSTEHQPYLAGEGSKKRLSEYTPLIAHFKREAHVRENALAITKEFREAERMRILPSREQEESK